jgi:hypothetical protein
MTSREPSDLPGDSIILSPALTYFT